MFNLLEGNMPSCVHAVTNLSMDMSACQLRCMVWAALQLLLSWSRTGHDEISSNASLYNSNTVGNTNLPAAY
jgi:hypothetical protein